MFVLVWNVFLLLNTHTHIAASAFVCMCPYVMWNSIKVLVNVVVLFCKGCLLLNVCGSFTSSFSNCLFSFLWPFDYRLYDSISIQVEEWTENTSRKICVIFYDNWGYRMRSSCMRWRFVYTHVRRKNARAVRKRIRYAGYDMMWCGIIHGILTVFLFFFWHKCSEYHKCTV